MNAELKKKFESYPDEVRPILMEIRKLILDVAKDEDIEEIIETLKWGEPSYITAGGSAVRFDWKKKNPVKKERRGREWGD